MALSLFGSNTAVSSTSNSITAPASIAADDLIVMWDCCYGSFFGVPTDVVPTGFTRLTTNTLNLTDSRAVASYKKADGSEGGASIVGMNPNEDGSGTGLSNKIIAVFRDSGGGFATISPSSVSQQITNANPTAQNVAASGGAAPLIVLGFLGNIHGAVVSPRTWSPAFTAEIGTSSSSAWLGYKFYDSSPADHSIDMDDEGNRNVLASCYIALTVAAAGQPKAKREGGVPFMGQRRGPVGGQVWMPERRLLAA